MKNRLIQLIVLAVLTACSSTITNMPDDVDGGPEAAVFAAGGFAGSAGSHAGAGADVGTGASAGASGADAGIGAGGFAGESSGGIAGMLLDGGSADADTPDADDMTDADDSDSGATDATTMDAPTEEPPPPPVTDPNDIGRPCSSNADCADIPSGFCSQGQCIKPCSSSADCGCSGACPVNCIQHGTIVAPKRCLKKCSASSQCVNQCLNAIDNQLYCF